MTEDDERAAAFARGPQQSTRAPWQQEWEREAQQPADPRKSEKNVRITVDVLWPAGYSTPSQQVYDVNRWALRDGVLILIRSLPGEEPDRTHIPLTSIARWTVTRP